MFSIEKPFYLHLGQSSSSCSSLGVQWTVHTESNLFVKYLTTTEIRPEDFAVSSTYKSVVNVSDFFCPKNYHENSLFCLGSTDWILLDYLKIGKWLSSAAKYSIQRNFPLSPSRSNENICEEFRVEKFAFILPVGMHNVNGLWKYFFFAFFLQNLATDSKSREHTKALRGKALIWIFEW